MIFCLVYTGIRVQTVKVWVNNVYRIFEGSLCNFLCLDEIEELEKCSTISRTAYEATLMKYHPWVVQVQLNIRYNGTKYLIDVMGSLRYC